MHRNKRSQHVFSMNEFDFQSEEFLDSLLMAPAYAPSEIPGTDSSLIPVTSTGSFVPAEYVHSASGTLYDHSTNTTTDTKPCADTKPSQSFPPNFYAEINYESDAGTTDSIKIETNNGGDDVAMNKEEIKGIEEFSQNCESIVNESQIYQPEIEIAINNVVCSFAVRCHLNLRTIATNGINVIYKRENGVRFYPD